MNHFFAFPITSEQWENSQQVIENIRSEPENRQNRKALIDNINQMADVGIDHFFVKSLKQADLGYFKIKAAEVGLQTFKKGLQPILRQLVMGMSDAQILKIVDFMEGVMIRKLAD